MRGLEHARAAEHIYQRLGQHRPLTRVWETAGRLALQQGYLEMAQARLMAALNLQQQLGDVAGLARSTAALADACMLAGQYDDAVALLANSITLNAEKGSPSTGMPSEHSPTPPLRPMARTLSGSGALSQTSKTAWHRLSQSSVGWDCRERLVASDGDAGLVLYETSISTSALP